MKKILFISIIVFSVISVKGQLVYSLGFSYDNYYLLDDNIITKPTTKPSIGLAYYFKNHFGLKTGVYSTNRYFDYNTETIFTENYQIPILLSNYKKNDKYPFGYAVSLGYMLTVPFESKNSGGNNFDMGLSHSAHISFIFDGKINDFANVFIGFESNFDFLNKNDIKFYEQGITVGVSFLFAKNE